MKRVWVGIFAAAMTALVAVGGARAEDVAGSADHPLIGRYEGSSITFYEVSEFDNYQLALGPTKARALTQSRELEGKVFRISYLLPVEKSIIEVARNFEQRLVDQGFEILFDCDAKACGSRDFRYAIETINTPHMQIDAWKFHYLAAERTAGGITTSAAILVSINNKKIFTQVMVVEAGELEIRMIDAGAMASALSESGHIALYGIHFDTDSATIKPESRPTLDEIAKLLQAQPDLGLLVVGHTDNQGKLGYNMDLSKQRAQSVIADLTATYSIAADRLSGHGVGFLAPVATNDGADGRAQNRRVELVKR